MDEDRFDREAFKIYALLEQVLLKAVKHDKYKEELKEVTQFLQFFTSPCLGPFQLIFNQSPEKTPMSSCHRFVRTCRSY